MIRLKDVAARAGVSLMTVSKVLRDASDVSQATKAKVRRVAEEMGYVPDALAQGLRTRKSKLLGLIVPDLVHPFWSAAASSIEEATQGMGFELIAAQTQENLHREELSLRRLLARRVDGLFVAPVYRLAPTATIYEELARSGTPTVLLGGRAPFCSQFLNVETDDANASYRMTQHLLSLGHTRIAFFAGPPAAPWSQERLEGYRRALREAGIAYDDHLVFTAGSTLEDGQKAALQFLNEGTSATAIQTVSDFAAIGVILILTSQGLQVPQNISVTGFDDHLIAEHYSVALTTARVPKQSVGQSAAELMMRLLRGEKPEPRRLPVDVIYRASTSAPSNTPWEKRAVQAPVPTGPESADDIP